MKKLLESVSADINEAKGPNPKFKMLSSSERSRIIDRYESKLEKAGGKDDAVTDVENSMMADVADAMGNANGLDDIFSAEEADSKDPTVDKFYKYFDAMFADLKKAVKESRVDEAREVDPLTVEGNKTVKIMASRLKGKESEILKAFGITVEVNVDENYTADKNHYLSVCIKSNGREIEKIGFTGSTTSTRVGKAVTPGLALTNRVSDKKQVDAVLRIANMKLGD